MKRDNIPDKKDHGEVVETDNDSEYGTHTVFGCHKIGQACRVVQGADFDYCPFCGDEL